MQSNFKYQLFDSGDLQTTVHQPLFAFNNNFFVRVLFLTMNQSLIRIIFIYFVMKIIYESKPTHLFLDDSEK